MYMNIYSYSYTCTYSHTCIYMNTYAYPTFVHVLSTCYANFIYFIGCMNAMWSLLFAYFQQYTPLFSQTYTLDIRGHGYTICNIHTQTLIWLQIFIATELLIFSTRIQSYIWYSIRPSYILIISVIVGIFIFCILAGQSNTFGQLSPTDIVIIIVYNIVTLLIVDACKVQLLLYFNECRDTLPDLPPEMVGEEDEIGGELGVGGGVGVGPAVGGGVGTGVGVGKRVAVIADAQGNLIQTVIDDREANKREVATVERMQNIEIKRGYSCLRPEQIQLSRALSTGTTTIAAARTPSQAHLINRMSTSVITPRSATDLGPIAINQSISPGTMPTNASGLTRGGLISSGSLHPNTPGSLAGLLLRRGGMRGRYTGVGTEEKEEG